MTVGTGRGPQPSSAGGNSAAQPSANVGMMLASNAEALPKGHAYVEPYFFDGISGGKHHPGTSGFYQYGLLDNWTVGMQPFFSVGTARFNRDIAMGDFKLLSQVRLNHFTPERRVPSIAVVTNRSVEQCPATEEVLKRWNLAYDAILCGSGDKNPRFERVRSGEAFGSGPVEVVAYLGDNINDFPAASQALRKKGVHVGKP